MTPRPTLEVVDLGETFVAKALDARAELAGKAVRS